jgi:pimeloyl-ACP methyl ester carboxylesterase
MGNSVRKFIKKGVLLAGGVFAFNTLYNKYATRKHLLKASPENYFNWKGVKVYYKKSGSGSPVILLHSLHPAASSYEWERVADSLQDAHTVYMLDLPGCGRSDKPDVLYVNFYYVKLIQDFMESMNIPKAAIVASNLTASIAVMAHAYNPASISSLILINPPSPEPLSKSPDLLDLIKYRAFTLPLIGGFIYNLLASRSQIDLAFSEKYFYNPFHDTEELVDIYFESAHIGNESGRYLAACIYGKYLNTDTTRAIRSLSVPVLIMEGRCIEEGEETLRKWKELNLSIQTVSIEHTRQLPMLEEPEITAEAILQFLQNNV